MAMKIKLTQLILLICFCLINTGLSFAAPWQDYNILNNPKPKVNYNNMALNNIIENSQNNADTFYYRRGLQKHEAGDINGAFEDIIRAIQINPNNAMYYVERGNLYKETKEDSEANKDFQLACKINPAFCTDVEFTDTQELYVNQQNSVEPQSDQNNNKVALLSDIDSKKYKFPWYILIWLVIWGIQAISETFSRKENKESLQREYSYNQTNDKQRQQDNYYSEDVSISTNTRTKIYKKERKKDWFSLKEEVIAKYGRKCINCGTTDNIDVHHKIPLSEGGTNCWDNLIPLCRNCHEELHKFKLGQQNNTTINLEYGSKISKNKKSMIGYKICNAIEHGYRIKIKYKSVKSGNEEFTERIIRLLEIKLGCECKNDFVQNSKYDQYKKFLRAFCELRNEERLFRMDRIIDVIEEYKN